MAEFEIKIRTRLELPDKADDLHKEINYIALTGTGPRESAIVPVRAISTIS